MQFVLVGFKTPQAVPVVFPMTRWIYAANDDKMHTDKKR